MSFSDRIRAFFAKRGSPELERLVTWIAERKGVEGFVEPRTTTNPTSLLLVDRDGAHTRAPVREARDAYAFCEKQGIPVYDARVIGYPQRMKDFERRRRSGPSAEELDAEIAELEKRLQDPETDG